MRSHWPQMMVHGVKKFLVVFLGKFFGIIYHFIGVGEVNHVEVRTGVACFGVRQKNYVSSIQQCGKVLTYTSYISVLTIVFVSVY